MHEQLKVASIGETIDLNNFALCLGDIPSIEEADKNSVQKEDQLKSVKFPILYRTDVPLLIKFF